MKQILTLSLFLFFTTSSIAQYIDSAAIKNDTTGPAPRQEGPLSISNVYVVKGKSKTEIYTQARLWCVSSFKNFQAVNQMDDKELGIISGKGAFEISHYFFSLLGREDRDLWVRFEFVLIAKDEKYKVEFKNFTLAKRFPSKNEMDMADGAVMDYQDVAPFSKNIMRRLQPKYNEDWINMRVKIKMQVMTMANSLFNNLLQKSATDF